MTDVHVDTRSPHAFQHRPLANVAATDPVAHLGQHDRDRTHARTTDTNDVKPLRRREIEGNVG